MTTRVHRLVFDGHREVDALLLPDGAPARRRILSRWAPGADVRRGDAGLLFRLPAPVRFDCATAPGLPLIALGEVLLGAPVSAHQLTWLAPLPGDVVFASAGQVMVAPSFREAVDPSTWLDVSDFVLEPAVAFRAPPRPVQLAVPPRKIDLRAPIADVGSEASRALAAALQASKVAPPPPWWRRTMLRFLRWLQGPEERDTPRLPSGGQAQQPPPGRMRQLSTWLARKQADYVERLLTMFERDDVEEALRHAIPLSRDQGTSASPPATLPVRRDQLALSYQGAGRGGASMQLGPDVYQQLMQRYRAAAAELERAGRIDEAAFVLADLLSAPLDAIALFERHKRYTEAARLAEGRELDAALQVRLWFLAGDLARAVLVARKTNAFSGAVTRLESTHADAGRQLRMLWADHLASTGDYAGAVKVAQSLPDAKPLILKWIDLGGEGGGPAAAALRVRRLDYDPEHWHEPVARTLAELRTPTPEDAATRAAIAEALLVGTKASAAAREPLRREAVRALLRDEATNGIRQASLLERLITMDDGPMRADLPSFVPAVRAGPLTISWSFDADRAALTPYDAVPLPGGRMAVALGDNGVALLNRQGRVTWRAEVPAFKLVAALEHGELLALSPRTDVTTVSRVSLSRKTAARWGEVSFTAHAQEFGGGVWFVSEGSNLLGLDTLSPSPLALWRIPVAQPARVVSIGVTATTLATLSQLAPLTMSRQQFTLADLKRVHGPLSFYVAGGATGSAIDGQGSFVALFETSRWRSANITVTPAQLPYAGPLAGTPAVSGLRSAIPVLVEGGVEVLLETGLPPLVFRAATSVTCRWSGAVLTCAADNGRVVSIDVERRETVSQLVVRAGR